MLLCTTRYYCTGTQVGHGDGDGDGDVVKVKVDWRAHLVQCIVADFNCSVYYQ